MCRRAALAALGALASVVAMGATGMPAPSRDAPPSADALAQLKVSGDRAGQRRHAWSIFERFVGAAGSLHPAFDGWHTEDETFADDAARSPRASPWPRFVASRPVAGVAPGGHGFDTADAPVLAFSLYNDAAYRHIRSLRLFDAAELARLRTTRAPDPVAVDVRTVPPFPTNAVVLKTAWWPIAADRPTAMPVWDPERNAPRRGGNAYTSWSRVIAVDPSSSGDAGDGGTMAVDFAGRTHPAARRVPLAEFPHVVLDEHAAAALRREPTARKALRLALGRDVRRGDALALVGVHVATREVPDWIWATAWWHDEPDRGPFAADRPVALRGAWRNFLLDVAFDEVTPLEADGTPHVAFNPWLEGRFPDGGHGGGTASNCLACHRRASWPAAAFLPVTRGAADVTRDPAYAPDRLRTQFLWSIALRARSDEPLLPAAR